MGFSVLTLKRRLQSVEHVVHRVILRRMCVPGGFCSPMPTYTFHNCSADRRQSSGFVIITDYARSHVEWGFWKVGKLLQVLCKPYAHPAWPADARKWRRVARGQVLYRTRCHHFCDSEMPGEISHVAATKPSAPNVCNVTVWSQACHDEAVKLPLCWMAVLGLRVAGYLRTAKSDSVILAE